MPHTPISEQLNTLWRALLKAYPDGVSNTSTTKYNEIRALLSDILAVSVEEIYATGAKTRTSNLDTRFVQGNQAGRHTKVGVAFMQVEDGAADVKKLSDSAVVTSRKFVDGSDNTVYDVILIFVESAGGMNLTRVIQSGRNGYFEKLKIHFPTAELVSIVHTNHSATSPSPASIVTQSGAFGSLKDLVVSFNSTAANANLEIGSTLVKRVAACLLSKRFIIATGLAGSGKTKLAQAFARWLSVPTGCYTIVPVGADWTGNENVLGYPNGLDKETYVSRPALDLVIHAKENPDIPHFLILDEMNLSHVERYFADILSVIESEETIRLYDGAERKANGNVIPDRIELPKNLFIIGTVNVDETTYMFSPKVLDRANVIEFRMEADELESFLSNPAKPDLLKLDGKGDSFGKAFVEASKSSVEVPVDVKTAYEAEMLLLFEALQAHGAEFGYRTAHEAARFIHFYKLLGNHPDGDVTWFNKAFDCVVFQKLLPKLHGSRAKLGPLLRVLWFLCVNDTAGRGADALKATEAAARSTDNKTEPSAEVPAGAPYPLSAEKIGRMWRLLRDNGFASFAEA